MLVLGAIVLFNARIITESSNRLINFSQEYVEPAPFEFVVNEQKMVFAQYDDAEITLELKGQTTPKEVYIQSEGVRYLMTDKGHGKYQFTYQNIERSRQIEFEALGFSSKKYLVEVIPKPEMKDLKISLDYPAYTAMLDEEKGITNALRIPEGTVVKWSFIPSVNGKLTAIIGEDTSIQGVSGNDAFNIEHEIAVPKSVRLTFENRGITQEVRQRITVVKDGYPTVDVQQIADSANKKQVYFRGRISDDYGFSGLTFSSWL